MTRRIAIAFTLKQWQTLVIVLRDTGHDTLATHVEHALEYEAYDRLEHGEKTKNKIY